ncbi:MAG: C39 family peptidase [bacterium]|nr:C39 family peptidase [bacterium]
MKWIIALAVLVTTFAAGSVYIFLDADVAYRNPVDASTTGASSVSSKAINNSVGSELPTAKTIPGLAWVGQTFNNCSSVALFIVLSRWDIKDTQEKIAEATRPWNNPRGDNDDKSVTLYELADYARTRHGLLAYVRPAGNIELLKKFIAADIPVLTRALTYRDDDIVHYRVIRGYNESQQVVIESDGIEGQNQLYSYKDWMHFWKDFNYSYLIVVPKEKKQIVESILGEEANEQWAWRNAKARAEDEVARNSSDMRAKYNIVTALFYLGDYEGTAREFEKIESSLTRRKLWYQMEPIEAYFKLGKFDRVIELADSVINDNNKSVSELYVLKGKVYESRGQTAEARAEYEIAIYYNKNLQSAKDALAQLGT